MFFIIRPVVFVLIQLELGSAMRAKTLVFFIVSKCPTKYGIQGTHFTAPRHNGMYAGQLYSVTGELIWISGINKGSVFVIIRQF